MLLGLDPLLGPDLLHALAAMGHGDRIVLVDANYPATRGRRLIHLPHEQILERVNASGEVFISHTRLGGRYVLRLAIGSFRTTEEDVRLAWDVLRREAAGAP
jgi:L-fucose mutarotase/ribose pyranase (RbsD/FucU family)